MSLLPGVPNMGPAPVSASPTIRAPGKAALGGPHGIAKIAQSTGKPGNTEHLGNLMPRMGKGLTSAGGGDPMAHSLNHYGKATAPAALGSPQMAGGIDPTAHGGSKMIRGESGAMRSHIREGGLGPGPMGTPGGSSDYSMQNTDQE